MRLKTTEILVSIISLYLSFLVLYCTDFFNFDIESDFIYKIFPSILTAFVAVYVGYEARKITKKQKDIAYHKLMIDLHDKRVVLYADSCKCVDLLYNLLIDLRRKDKRQLHEKIEFLHEEITSLYVTLNRNIFFYTTDEKTLAENMVNTINSSLEKILSFDSDRTSTFSSDGGKTFFVGYTNFFNNKDIENSLESSTKNISLFKDKLSQSLPEIKSITNSK